MSFLDEITSFAMEQMKDGLSDGEGALQALSVNVVGDNSAAYLQEKVGNWVYDAALSVEELDNILIDFQTNGIGSPNLSGFVNINEVDALKNALDYAIGASPAMSVRDLYRQLTTTTHPDSFIRMEKHTEDVKKNLPDIMKISGTANALRGATTYSPVTDQPAPSSCSQDGAVIAAITTTAPPATSSSMDEVAGTVSAQGDVLQRAIFDCADDLILAINVASTGSATDPSWSIDVHVAVGKSGNPGSGMVYKATNSLFQGTGWVADAVALFEGVASPLVNGWADDISSWDLTDIIDKQTCTTTATQVLDDKITDERAAVAFPETDENGLSIADPGADTGVMDLQTSPMVAEIKSAAFAVSVVGFSANPCSQSISARHGTPEVAVVGTSVTVAAIANTAGEEMSEVQGLTVAEFEAKKLRIANASLFSAKQDALAARIDVVNWESPAYTMMVSQKTGISSPVSLEFVIGVDPSGDGIDVEYIIPATQILQPPPAGDTIDVSLMVSFDSPTSKNVLNGIAEFLNSEIKNSGNELANADLKLWVFHSPTTGFYTLVIFGGQLTQFFAELTINDTSGEFSSFLFPASTVDFIKDYMYTLKTEDELDEFETTVMVGIE